MLVLSSIRTLLLLALGALAVSAQTTCFSTNTELRNAVVSYVANPTPANPISVTYGYPIGSWCVDNVTDFSNVFSGLSTFDEPLTNWVTSKATTMGTCNSFFVELNPTATTIRPHIERLTLYRWSLGLAAAMFKGASKFNQDLSQLDVSKVVSFGTSLLVAVPFGPSAGLAGSSLTISHPTPDAPPYAQPRCFAIAWPLTRVWPTGTPAAAPPSRECSKTAPTSIRAWHILT